MVFKFFLTRKQVVTGIVFMKFCVWIKCKVNAGALKSTVVLLCIVAFLRKQKEAFLRGRSEFCTQSFIISSYLFFKNYFVILWAKSCKKKKVANEKSLTCTLVPLGACIWTDVPWWLTVANKASWKPCVKLFWFYHRSYVSYGHT